jgi:hypothetical protein
LTFLSPIPALIAAALTVPALLVLYFLKLRRRPIRVSSTMLWDQAIRDLQVNVPFRLIRPTWLLILQLMILALFLSALARPAIDLPQGSAGRVVLLIDRSASMSARDGGTESSPRTRLEAAKARALTRLEQLGRSGSTFAVVAFATEAVLVNSFSSASAARSAIEGIEPTDQPGDLRSALHLASGLLSGDADESAARARGLAVLFSDGSFGGSESLSIAGAEFRFEQVGPAAVSTEDGSAGEAVINDSHDNLGIVAIAARREWDDPTAIRVFARIVNASERAVTTPVAMVLEGREVDSSVVTIPGAAGESESRGLGSAAVTFRLETREGGIATVQIGREDVLAADNSASLVIAAASKPRILVVIPDAGDARRYDWIVTDVIEELQLPMRVMSASLYAQEAGGAGGARSLRYDLVIFDRVRPSVPPPIPSLSFGAGIGDVGVGTEPGRGTYFLSWKRSHPVLRHASLDGVHVARPLAMSGVGPDEELATGTDGPLIVVAAGAGPRRIVAAFELSQTNWPVQVGFPIFLASAIDYLSLRAEDRAGKAFSTGEPARLEGAGTGPITLEGPKRITVRADGPASLGILEQAGVYQIAGAEGRAAVAVNLLDETESEVAVRDSLRVSGQVVTGAAGDGGPREIWAWLVLAALILLSVEWLINAWMMRV